MSNPATDDRTISVIYVDDEPSLLEIGRLFLQKSGTFTVTTAESADEAIQTLKKQSFDAIISDYQMPGMDGIAFLKYLRTAGDTTPFIIFTGKGREDVVIEALNEGADFYLQKGGDPKSQFAELSNKVRYAVTRRQGEERLIESEERYRSLFNQSMEGIYLHDLEGRILDVNMMACMQSGYSREEWLTRTIFDGHPDTSRWNLPKNEILHAWSQWAPGQRFLFEGEHQRKDGTTYPVEISTGIIHYGNEYAVLAIVKDITDRKKAEESLLLKNAAIDSSLNGICITDLDGILTYVNPAFLSIWGGSDTNEILGKSILSLWTPEEESREIVDALQKTGSWSGEVSGTRKDGSEIVVELAVSLVRDAHGAPVAMMGSFVDITERKAAEEALQTASKKLHLLSSITRHDILNQVMALQGYLDLTQREINDPRLSRYHTEAEKAANAIQKQIEFTRVYENLGVHAPTWQPLSPLIGGIYHTHPPIHHDCGEVSVYADPMFEKVLQNLYDNTLRYAEGADCVMIRCEEQDGSLLITWEDNGPGVPDNVKERIFEKGVGKNTGLGLFLAREILAITGITISETGVYGEGARFEILVPGSAWRRDGEETG